MLNYHAYPSEDIPADIRRLQLKDVYGYVVDGYPDVVYCERDGLPLHMTLLCPIDYGMDIKFPLVVFVQGSGWGKQPLYQHLSHLVRLCGKGYAVAIVEYRPSDVAPFPAQIQDVKTAIRYLRKNAEKYNLLTDKIAIWGDSSGAHTSLMAGITRDGELDTQEYADYSAKVECIVDWYAPTNIAEMANSVQNHSSPNSPEGRFIGGHDVSQHPELVAPTIPMNYISDGRDVPPVLIMHGTADQIVPFTQSLALYDCLKANGKQVEMYALEGALHAIGGFHCDEALDVILEFIGRQIPQPLIIGPKHRGGK